MIGFFCTELIIKLCSLLNIVYLSTITNMSRVRISEAAVHLRNCNWSEFITVQFVDINL
jgi:hypothetical protein